MINASAIAGACLGILVDQSRVLAPGRRAGAALPSFTVMALDTKPPTFPNCRQHR